MPSAGTPIPNARPRTIIKQSSAPLGQLQKLFHYCLSDMQNPLLGLHQATDTRRENDEPEKNHYHHSSIEKLTVDPLN